MAPTLESLHERLDNAAKLLDEAAREIRDIPLEPTKPNIRRIGEILAQVNELQHEIYQLRPELIPTHLWEVRREPWPELIVRGAFRRAEIAEAGGDASTAVQYLEFLIRTQPAGEHVPRAQGEIERLKRNGHDT